MSAPLIHPLFPLGQIVATPGALDALDPADLARRLRSHSIGNWGCVCREDWQANDNAVLNGDRILSAYPIDPTKACNGHGDNCVWIITEADRSVTTFLLPSEY